jgi:hypothetical protein
MFEVKSSLPRVHGLAMLRETAAFRLCRHSGMHFVQCLDNCRICWRGVVLCWRRISASLWRVG